jgi:hypothetical protein
LLEICWRHGRADTWAWPRLDPILDHGLDQEDHATNAPEALVASDVTDATGSHRGLT